LVLIEITVQGLMDLILLFSKSFEHVKGDLIHAINEFHNIDKWPKGYYTSLIAVIPKCENPLTLE